MAHPVLQFQILSKNPDEAAKFYGDVFNWAIDANNALGYRTINTGSQHGIQGGIWPAPPQAPTFTQLFIGVDDINQSLTKATDAGAKILIPATRLPDGDVMAVLHDPQGMPFALWQKP
jgi:predicted enzyme related to lactoylglutathione lyase